MQLFQSLQMFRNLQEIIVKNDLLSKYQYLLDSFNKAGSKPFSDNLKSKIDDGLAKINEVNQELTAMFWNASLKSFFPKLEIENIIRTNIYSVSTVKPEEYQSIINHYTYCSSSIMAMLENIQPFVKESIEIAATEDNLTNNDEAIKIFRIYFINNTGINTFDELEKYYRIWNNILIAFSKLTREEENPIIVQYVDKNCLFLNLGLKTANAVLKAIVEILNTQRRLLEIKNLKREIHHVELSNEAEFEKLLDEELANVIDENSAILTRDLMASYEWDYIQNQKIFDAIQIASKQILNFIEKGGKIDARQNNSNDELNVINKNIINELIKIENMFKNNNNKA